MAIKDLLIKEKRLEKADNSSTGNDFFTSEDYLTVKYITRKETASKKLEFANNVTITPKLLVKETWNKFFGGVPSDSTKCFVSISVPKEKLVPIQSNGSINTPVSTPIPVIPTNDAMVKLKSCLAKSNPKFLVDKPLNVKFQSSDPSVNDCLTGEYDITVTPPTSTDGSSIYRVSAKAKTTTGGRKKRTRRNKVSRPHARTRRSLRQRRGANKHSHRKH
jgi:hypothetical protein